MKKAHLVSLKMCWAAILEIKVLLFPFSKRQSVIFYFNFSSEVHERQREKKLTEERYRAKDRKRKRDKYAELVGQSLGLKLQLEFFITLIFQALRARTLD